MKTETQIAKGNVDLLKNHKGTAKRLAERILYEQKTTWKRWLEFLDLEIKNTFDIKNQFFKVDIDRKITDLKNAIKTYEDAGI